MKKIYIVLVLSVFTASCTMKNGTEAAAQSIMPSPTPTVLEESVKKGENGKCDENDYDCFITAAKTCEPASVMISQTVDLGVTTIIGSDLYEIKGRDAKGCRLYRKVLVWEMKDNPEFIEKMKSKGLELPERDEEISKMNEKRMKDAIGTDGICSFATERLAKLFEDWKDGSFSSEDFRGAKCKGTYFTPANGFVEGF